MTPLDVVGLLAAGFAAGGINSIVGSGSLVTFPTLLATGLPSVLANVTNTVGISPGSASSVVGYRRELAGQRRRCIGYGACTTVGAVIGGVLLLTLPGSVFDSVVPVLVLISAVLIALQPWIVARLGTSSGERGRGLRIAGAVGVFLTGIYGGYFGAAQGVILIALLGIVIDDDLQRLNGLKNVLAGVANVIAALLFIAVTDVAWEAAGLLAVSSVVGAQVGAAFGRRIPPKPLRVTIAVAATVVAIVLFIRNA